MTFFDRWDMPETKYEKQLADVEFLVMDDIKKDLNIHLKKGELLLMLDILWRWKIVE